MKRRWVRCVRCGRTGQMFYRDRTRKSGYSFVCIRCTKHWWHTSKTWLQKHRAQGRLARARNSAFVISYLQGKRCVDCGEPRLGALTFDHVRGRKRADVSKMITQKYGLATIVKEIAKCEIRCANCHLIRTAKQLGHARALAKFAS